MDHGPQWMTSLGPDWLPLTPFKILNSNQSQYGKLGLFIIKVPKASPCHVGKYHGPPPPRDQPLKLL